MKEILPDLPWYLALMAALIAAIIKWPRYKDTPQRYFLHFLIYVTFNEILGYILIYIFDMNNSFIYNIYTCVSFLFYFYWFRLILVNKRIILIFVILFVGSTTYSLFFESFWNDLWLAPYYVGTILILLCSVMYFSSLVRQEEVVHFRRLQPFWIATGLLVFHFGFLPTFIFSEWSLIGSPTNKIILTSLIVILYSSYFISFLCLRKN